MKMRVNWAARASALLMLVSAGGAIAELQKNEADVGMAYKMPQMEVTISPTGGPPTGCSGGQYWDVVVGGCTAPVKLRDEDALQSCGCTCPDQGSCTSQQEGKTPVLGWRLPPNGGELVASRGATVWGACTETSNSCFASPPPPPPPPPTPAPEPTPSPDPTPSPGQPTGKFLRCVESWQAYTSNQTEVPDSSNASASRQPGTIRINGVEVYRGPIKLFYTRDFYETMGDSRASQTILDKYQYDSSFWIYGTDGGIYYPFEVTATQSAGDTPYDSWWYMGYCVIKNPD